MKRVLSILIMLFALNGCASTRFTQFSPSMQTQNKPFRTVRLLVLSDGSHSDNSILSAIESTSLLIESQVGIRFVVGKIKHCSDWIGDTPDATIYKLIYLICQKEKGYDEVWAFEGRPVLSYVLELAGIPYWGGYTDNILRRCLIIRNLDTHVLAHEAMHTFILDDGKNGLYRDEHSIYGLMSPFALALVPGIYITDNYLSGSDRDRVLKNKWRNF